MYYGDFLEAVGHTEEIQPAYVLVVYENEHFRLPWRYGDGFKKIRILDRSRSYVVLEAFGTPWEVLRAYARLSDIICYWRVTRSRDHREAFKWRKLDVAPLLSLLMWRSILLSWPYLEILEKQVQRITEVVRPAVALFYKFEFTYGRAIIRGTRQSVQHVLVIHLPLYLNGQTLPGVFIQ